MRPFGLLPHLRGANSGLERQRGQVAMTLVNRLLRLGLRLGLWKEVTVVAEGKER